MTSSVSQGVPRAHAWVNNPASDLLLGCGMGYLLFFFLLVFAGVQVESALPLGLMPLVLLFLSVPHYGATLLRVYESAEARQKYQLFAYHFTALIWLFFAIGVHNALAGSLLLTLYLTWSPWHYSGQNYGISLMFLGRRGVQVPLLAKRLLYGTFILSFLLTFIELHGALYEPNFAPAELDGVHYEVMPLGIPIAAANVLIFVVGLAYLCCLAGAATLLLRVAHWRALVPTALLVFSQALWFVIPMFAYHFDLFQGLFPLAEQNAGYVFFWIASAHAIQYLWITSYFARRSDQRGTMDFLFRCLLAGSLIWVIPSLLFAPSALGRLPFDQGLGLLIAAAVNVHHFMLDGAIWKLRDGRIARILLRSAPADAPAGNLPAPALRRVLYPGFVVLGLSCVLIQYFSTIESHFGFSRAQQMGDVARMEQAVERLSLMGQDSARRREVLGRIELAGGDVTGAKDHFQRAVELQESVPLLNQLAQAQLAVGDLTATVATVERSISLARNSGLDREAERLQQVLQQLRSTPRVE